MIADVDGTDEQFARFALDHSPGPAESPCRVELLWFGTSGELLRVPSELGQPPTTSATLPCGHGEDEAHAVTDLIAQLAQRTGHRISSNDLWRVRDGPPVLYTTCGAKLHDVRAHLQAAGSDRVFGAIRWASRESREVARLENH